MLRIFISYRRHDSPSSATLLNDRLQMRFKPENVFFDVDDIAPGEAFPHKIRTHLEEADVVLAVIGPSWVSAVDEDDNRRLEKADDFVAIELTTALQNDKLIIPVLVDGAKAPAPTDLPDRLKFLADLNAHTISKDRINADVTDLIAVIEQKSREGVEGAITFLFTDIEASSSKWERHLEAMRLALERHDEIIEQAVRKNGGDLFAESGDGGSTAFHSPLAAIQTSLDAQRALQQESWGAVGELRVRMAIHTGAPQQRRGNYFGPTLNRTARLLELANGGQIVISQATYELVHDRLPPEAELHDRGKHRLRSLTVPEHVYLLTHPKLARVDTPLRAGALPKRPLPHHLPRLIGRRAEVARVRELVESSRLVTLTGVGGTGKTRLAYAVAHSYSESDFPDGIHLVPLETVQRADHVEKAVGAALEIRERPGQGMLEVITAELDERRLLLVVDNCEHVIDAIAHAVSRIIEHCPNVRVLATSREPLALRVESAYGVPGLELPADMDRAADELVDVEAVDFFVDRASAANASFRLTDANAREVAELCARLEGIPLAIELAASRANTLTPAQLIDELEHPLRVLRGSARGVAERHRTIEATIQWSVDLLTDEEKDVFFALSVLEGSFTLEAARAVAARDDPERDVLEAMHQLVAKSLLLPAPTRSGGHRYRMLATLREFGREQLVGLDLRAELGRRHAEYFLELAERFAAELQGPDQEHARDELDLEHDNLRAALDWAVAGGDRDMAGRLAVALRWFWYWGGHIQEGHGSMDRVLELLSDERDVLRGYVAMGAGILADVHGDLEHASSRLGVALELGHELDDPTLVSRTLAALGVVAKDHGVLAEAAARFDESMAVDQTTGEDVDYEIALRFAGEVAYLRGDYDTATRQLDEAYAKAGRIGRTGEIAWTTTHMGELLRRKGRTADARVKLEEATALHREIRYPRGEAWSLMFLGMAERDAGRADSAEEIISEALDGFRDVADHRGIPYALVQLAGLARQRGALDQAQRLASEAREAGLAIDDRRAVAWSDLEEAAIAWAGGVSDRAKLEEALAEFGMTEDRSGAHTALRLAGRVVARDGDVGQGLVLLGAAAAVPGAPKSEELPADLVSTREVKPGIDERAKWEEGMRLDLDRALALATASLEEAQPE